jgi:hypothetical protein
VLISALDLAWGDCIDWQRKMAVAQYLKFVRCHQLPEQYYSSHYGAGASVDDARSALFVSSELESFSFHALAADPDRFEQLYEELRTRMGRCLVA